MIGLPFDSHRSLMELLHHDLRIPNCCLPVQMQQLFEAMDANHDGVLSREEFEQAPAGPWSCWGDIDPLCGVMI